GPASARLIEPDNGRTLSIAAMGWTPGTKGKIEAEVVVINPKTPEDLKQYQGKLKGAIVLRSPPTQGRPITDLNPQFGGNPPAPPGADRPADDKKPDDKKPEEKKADDKKADDKKADEKKPDDKKADDKAADQPPDRRPGNFDNRGYGEAMRFRREV